MNKRKQKIEIKSEDLLSSAEKDSLMDYDGTSDWFSSSTNSDLDIASNVFYDDFLNLLDLPLNLVDESLSQENKEIFQDLCCTSTPKSSRPFISKTFGDSGIEESIVKKIRTEDVYSHVLEDITNKGDSIRNRNVTELKNTSVSNTNSTCDDISFRKHVNILRKDFVLQTKSKTTNDSTCITKEQMIYYTGFKNYDIAIAILKHVKMPKSPVSSFKMELMALMKLRLDLPWLDMSFRFSIPEIVLKETVRKAFDVMSYSLDDLLPWHSQRKICRRSVSRIYYVYSLISSESSHVLIILSDSKKPILFVTENYKSDISALSVVLNNCSMYLIPGDTLCITDSTGINMFYTVRSPEVAFFLASPSPNHLSVVEKCHHLMTELLSDFAFLMRQNESFDICKLTKIACAITNINVVSEVSSFQLQRIFEKSSRFIL